MDRKAVFWFHCLISQCHELPLPLIGKTLPWMMNCHAFWIISKNRQEMQKKYRKFANEMHMSTSVKFSFLGENFSLFFKSFFTGESRLGLLFYLVTFPITSQLPEDSFPAFFIILEHDRDQSIKKVAELRCILHLWL